jgi:hypothetical protein
LTQINAPLLGILFLNMFRDITPAALRGAAMTNQLDQTQSGHLIGDMVVSFIFSSLIVTLPILALLLIMGVRFSLAGPTGFAISGGQSRVQSDCLLSANSRHQYQ